MIVSVYERFPLVSDQSDTNVERNTVTHTCILRVSIKSIDKCRGYTPTDPLTLF